MFTCELALNLLQDDDNALLQQALAMSMDDPAPSHDVQDTDMSAATGDDPELALGESIFSYTICFFFVIFHRIVGKLLLTILLYLKQELSYFISE